MTIVTRNISDFQSVAVKMLNRGCNPAPFAMMINHVDGLGFAQKRSRPQRWKILS